MAYNRNLVAERLDDLRKPKGKTISLKQLSLEIKEKTGVCISATQLNKYEKTGKTDIMNVENMMAIADYYEVSYDYLLGYSEAKKRENIDIQKKTGLSEEAIKQLQLYKKINGIGPVNFLLENPTLLDFILSISKAMDCSLLLNQREYSFSDEWDGKEFEEALENINEAVNKLGGIVIYDEGAVNYYRQEAINSLRDIVYDLVPKMQKEDHSNNNKTR